MKSFIYSSICLSLLLNACGGQVDLDVDVDTETFYACQNLNLDAPTETALYQDEAALYSIEIPYNPAWGTGGSAFTAYEEKADGSIEFGPIGLPSIGCKRIYRFWNEAPRSAEEVLDSIEQESGIESFFIEPTIIELESGNKAVTYSEASLCGEGAIIVIGEKTNVVFDRPCSRFMGYPEIEDIAGWLQFNQEVDLNQIEQEADFAYTKGDFFSADGELLSQEILDLTLDGLFGEAFLEGSKLARMNEWFRFKKEDELFVYLYGSADCGMCFFAGPYLKVNENSGEVQPLYREFIDSRATNLYLYDHSPYAIEVGYNYGWNGNKHHWFNEAFYLIDLSNPDQQSKQLLMEVPEDKTSVGCSIYCFSDKRSLEWLGQNKVRIYLFDKADSLEASAGPNPSAPLSEPVFFQELSW